MFCSKVINLKDPGSSLPFGHDETTMTSALCATISHKKIMYWTLLGSCKYFTFSINLVALAYIHDFIQIEVNRQEHKEEVDKKEQ